MELKELLTALNDLPPDAAAAFGFVAAVVVVVAVAAVAAAIWTDRRKGSK